MHGGMERHGPTVDGRTISLWVGGLVLDHQALRRVQRLVQQSRKAIKLVGLGDLQGDTG